MRAKFVLEMFSEDGDPIQDMGIGTMIIDSDITFLKKLSVSELEELYKRIHTKPESIIVDGDLFSSFVKISQIWINNDVVRALNYKRNIERRDKARSSGFKPGDAIKCQIKGVWWYGYPIFSKRGLIQTDNHGRIVANTVKGKMKVHPSLAIKLTAKEQQDFDKEYLEIAKKKMEKLEYAMKAYKNISISRFKNAKKEYDELLLFFENKRKNNG